MANTPNIGLPMMDPNVLQPSIPFNAAMQLLDAVAHIVVVATANTPPATTSADVGKVYLIDTAPTGAWAGRAGQLALCTASTLWAYFTPRIGWYADIGGGLKRLSADGWVGVGGGSGDLSVTKLYSSGDVVAAAGSYAHMFQARFAESQTEGWLLQTLNAAGESLGGIYANADGLSLVNNHGGVWNQVQLLNNGQILLNGRSPFQKTQIDGLGMIWNSGTSISFTSGNCYVPSLGSVLEFPSTITKSGLSLSASTWYHCYAGISSSNPDIEIVTTVPAAAYSGFARTKTGDSSRRYIGSLRTDSSGTVLQFERTPDGAIKYTNNVVNNVALNAGNATVATSVDLSPYCPVTSRVVDALCYNSSSSGGAFLFISNSEAIPISSSAYLAACTPASYLAVWLLMDSTQKITYMFNQASGVGGAYVRVMGYKFSR